MSKKQNPLKSVRVKLFMTLSLVILLIIIFLILVNNFVLGRFYLYSKRQTLKSVYRTVNDYYNNDKSENFEEKLRSLGAEIERVSSEKEIQKFRLRVG